jgi:hypothetical protein
MLLATLDEAFDKKLWHGPNLRAAYWKYVVRRRLLKQKRGSFVLAGSNFFERPEDGAVSEAAWKKDIAILEGEHRNLRETVAKFGLGRARFVSRGADSFVAADVPGLDYSWGRGRALPSPFVRINFCTRLPVSTSPV